ncbi:hypothetical protein WME97_08445 [Sorangium sp. So ce367]|uniref:hypothetical protein n=1 Tax=Sorangium sp. So ce367 TaxID=3133305 RepID=UPI003F5EAFDE
MAVIPNPFLIVAQREGEDRVTYALGTAFAAGDASLLVELLRALGANMPDAVGPLEVEFQVVGPTSRPDARFEIPDGTVVLFENKIVPNTLNEEQIKHHLDSFGAVHSSARRVMLAITPDMSPPQWWTRVAGTYPDVLFVHGSWKAVADWCRIVATNETRNDVTRLVLDWVIEYLKQRSELMITKATFDPKRMARVACEARSWLKDLEAQHDAQETFFSNVASALRTALGCGNGEPWMKIASRWGETWTPVSTYLEFWWPTPKLLGMPSAHVWAEAYLDEQDGKITLRTGLLFEGKAQVAAWHGRAQEVASQTFGDRYWDYRRGGAYAEVWAGQPLDLERLAATNNAVVADLVAWITGVLRAMEIQTATGTAC